MCKKFYLDIIKKPFFSKKSSFLYKNNNTLVFIVKSKVNKLTIYFSIKKIFGFKIKKIRTLLIKKKIKSKNKKNNCVKILKKVYVILRKNQNINIINKLN